MALSDRIRSVESGGNLNARNPRSSATGPDQFIDGTWLAMIAKHRPDIAQGRSREEILALRSDGDLSKAMTDAYASENSAVLSQRGLPVNPGTQYLAHFAGPQGAVGILSADPSAPAGSILGPAVVKANPFLAGMSAADLTAWADRKMSGTGSAPIAQAPQGAASVAPFSLGGGAPTPPGIGMAPSPSALAGVMPAAVSPLNQFVASLMRPEPQQEEMPEAPMPMAPRPQVNLRRRNVSLRG